MVTSDTRACTGRTTRPSTTIIADARINLAIDANRFELLPGERQRAGSRVHRATAAGCSRLGRVARVAHEAEVVHVRRQVVDLLAANRVRRLGSR